MNAFQKRITLRVLGIHAAVIFLVVVIPFMRGCFTRKPKELITMVVMENPGPPVRLEAVSEMSDPEPPTPAPEPPPERIPEPVKKKPVPTKKKPEPIKKKPEPVKNTEPKKPKWTPTKVDPTKSKKIEATPTKPTISEREFSEAFKGITSKSPTATGTPSEFAAYDAQVMRRFYGVWAQPAAPAARPAEVRISVTKSGRITGRTLVTKSGDTAFDQTVMAAVRSVSTLPKPPAGYPNNFVVRFSINN